MQARTSSGELRIMDLMRIGIPEHTRTSGLREEIRVEFEELIRQQVPAGADYVIEATGIQGRSIGIAMDAGKAAPGQSTNGLRSRVKQPSFREKLKEIRQIFYDRYGRYPTKMYIWVISGHFNTADYKDIEDTCLQHIAQNSLIFYSKQSVSHGISTIARPTWAIRGITCMGAGRQGAAVRGHLTSEQRNLADHFQTMMGQL